MLKEKLTKIFEIGIKGDKQFYSKQKVHEDLREKGYCIKTGLKFGFDFRVYPRGKKNGGSTHTIRNPCCLRKRKNNNDSNKQN